MNTGKIYVSIAELYFVIHYYEEKSIEMFRDYRTDPSEDRAEEWIEIRYTRDDIAKMHAKHPEFDLWYAEADCVYTRIGQYLPHRNRLLMHGAVVGYKGKGYMFTAPSGTGKSTHAALWRKYLGDSVTMINGDKPILAIEETVTVYGDPWGGKENWQTNTKAPLAAICLLKQAKENRIYPIQAGDYLSELMAQVYPPEEAEAAIRTLELVDRLAGKVPFYLLECDMSQEAVACSFETLTGEGVPNSDKGEKTG